MGAGNGLPQMKTIKNFWNRRVLGKTPPRPRGRVDPHSTNVIKPSAEKSRAKAKYGKKSGMIVYRAATGEWEKWEDVKVKEAPPVDDEVPPLDKVPNA